jgi:hypothetical protein
MLFFLILIFKVPWDRLRKGRNGLKQGGSRSGISKILSNKLGRKQATRRPAMVSSISWAEFMKIA